MFDDRLSPPNRQKSRIQLVHLEVLPSYGRSRRCRASNFRSWRFFGLKCFRVSEWVILNDWPGAVLCHRDEIDRCGKLAGKFQKRLWNRFWHCNNRQWISFITYSGLVRFSTDRRDEDFIIRSSVFFWVKFILFFHVSLLFFLHNNFSWAETNLRHVFWRKKIYRSRNSFWAKFYCVFDCEIASTQLDACKCDDIWLISIQKHPNGYQPKAIIFHKHLTVVNSVPTNSPDHPERIISQAHIRWHIAFQRPRFPPINHGQSFVAFGQ